MPLLIWAVPLLIWWVGGKMNPRIRLTSAKVEVGVEVEAELGKKSPKTSDELKIKAKRGRPCAKPPTRDMLRKRRKV